MSSFGASVAFPLRLRENGLLDRGSRAASVMALVQLMARTPRGSWAGSPAFGFRDLLEHQRNRADTARLAMERINEALGELEIRDFRVAEVVRELSPGRDTDTYAIAVELVGGTERLSATVRYEP